MRRWNGWGDSSVNTEVNAPALAWLAQGVGKGQAPNDALMQDMLALVKPSRLPNHALITTGSAERLRVGMGESYRDWICRRTGALPPLPDGVAFVETSEQVRELLDLAHSEDWIVIPYAGGTSVAGHLDCPISERPVLSLNLSRMNRLLYLDPKSQLARFGAGASGPQVEAQLRAHGYSLGHFPQSFEYSTVGGWVVTRSSGQQSLRYGRIEQIFAGGRFEAPVGTLHIPTLPASSAGPDLREIVLGSEGRFGVLTEVEVRVTRLPEHESFHAVFLPDWDSAEAAVRALAQRRLPLSMLRENNCREAEGHLAVAGRGPANPVAGALSCLAWLRQREMLADDGSHWRQEHCPPELERGSTRAEGIWRCVHRPGARQEMGGEPFQGAVSAQRAMGARLFCGHDRDRRRLARSEEPDVGHGARGSRGLRRVRHEGVGRDPPVARLRAGQQHLFHLHLVHRARRLRAESRTLAPLQGARLGGDRRAWRNSEPPARRGPRSCRLPARGERSAGHGDAR